MNITIFPNPFAQEMRSVEMTWPEFVDWLADMPETAKEDSELIKLCGFTGERNSKGCLRYDEAIDYIDGVECDYDLEQLPIDAAGALLSAAGVKCVLVPTHRYTDATPRYRIFAPTSVALPGADRRALVGKINGVLGGVLARESFAASQSFYVGACADYFVIEVDGQYVDLLDLPVMEYQKRDTKGKTLVAHEGTVEELLQGEDLHFTALAFVNKRIARNWTDDEIMSCLYGVSGQLSAVRGRERVETLLGGEVQRMLSSAREKGFGLGAPKLTPEQIATRRSLQQQEARAIGAGDDIEHLAELFDLDQMTQRFVFVSSGDLVFDRQYPRHILPLNSFKNSVMASRTDVPASKGNTKSVSTATLWMNSEARVQVQGVTFRAGADQITYDPEGRKCVNTWDGWHLPEVDERLVAERGAGLFVKQVEFLFKNDAGEFLDWLAHMMQNPGELPHIAWLHVSTSQGTGRGWLGGVLARLTRGYCAHGLDLVRHFESGFTSALRGKVLATIDEIREGGAGQWAHAQNLKKVITAEVRDINAKFMPTFEEYNACRWLMFSNHVSAIPLSDDDRRFRVVINNDAPLGPDYYGRLYSAVKDDAFIVAVAEFLLSRDISGYDACAPAPMTEAKRQLIDSMESDSVAALKDLAAHYPYPVVTSTMIHGVLHAAGCSDLKTIRMSHDIEDAGWARLGHFFPVRGKKVVAYCRRADHAELSRMDMPTLRLSFPLEDNGLLITGKKE